jgi:hypothetical protein
MRYYLGLFILVLNLISFDSNATNIVLPEDTIIPSKNKFTSSKIYVPKTLNSVKLITEFMEHLKAGKRTMGFLHPDEVAMIEEKKLVERRLFFDSYKVVSVGKRMAIIKIYTVRGASITCKKLMLRYYPNMHGNYLLVPGKVSTFEKKMGDITLKTVYLDTWSSESRCQ